MTAHDAEACAPISADFALEIPFHDLDPMNVVWHGNYARYFELARCRLLDQIDYNYPQMLASNYAWPVIHMQIKYIRPLVFQQQINVRATLSEWEHRLRIKYLITDLSSGERLTRGYTDQVAVDMNTQEMQVVSPDILYRKLGKSR